jgi:cystathionine beta-lyase
LREHIPQIKMIKPQASFLVWFDCRELNLSHRQLVNLFVKEAALALNDGEMFGTGGKGFMRMNIACPKSVLEQAMNQLKQAVRQYHT